MLMGGLFRWIGKLLFKASVRFPADAPPPGMSEMGTKPSPGLCTGERLLSAGVDPKAAGPLPTMSRRSI